MEEKRKKPSVLIPLLFSFGLSVFVAVLQEWSFTEWIQCVLLAGGIIGILENV